MTAPQRIIFDEVKEFILANREAKHQTNGSASESLTMPNTFSARERRFITTLADDLNLDLSWDEYDDEDQNLVVFRLPNDSKQQSGEDGEASVDEEGEWEDVDSEEDEEAQEAVDRVLKKYERAAVLEDDEEENFDDRHERAVQERMDDWKRQYYRVGFHYLLLY